MFRLCQCDAVSKSTELQNGQRNIHQSKADAAYKLLKTHLHYAQNDNEMYRFDFQQNLPSASIFAGDMFYSRMLWTYNFGLHDCKSGDAIMHLWSEAEAGRGSSVVAS
ncbi:hypothetical protein RRG08_029251 [Elysia crispata]|uniref:Uncharacterized protein n=1 Tax=Elysia crispata TaxID=231223 RepID=A0AAE1DZK6_9GAST|nr:hypothetical protein RRG08_029251 [Elysia crispata]